LLISNPKQPLCINGDIGPTYDATQTFVQGLLYAKGLLRKLEVSGYSERSKDVEDTSFDARVLESICFKLYTDDPASVIQDIINTIEGSPSADVSSVHSMVHTRLRDTETRKGTSLGTLFGPALQYLRRKWNSGKDAKYLVYALS
ncbi:hypothetical protein Tco_0939235, partial [Tanacetum coccineum]